jgi:hypothetical protein
LPVQNSSGNFGLELTYKSVDGEAVISSELIDKLRLALSSSAGLDKKFALTYDNTRFSDGVGAQLQRIYGIYSISRLLGVSYLHSPIRRVDYQGLAALETNMVHPGFHHEFNDLFQIKSDVMPMGDLHRIRLHEISIGTLLHLVALFDEHKTGGLPSLVEVALPYGIADRFPDCYEVCKEISPFASSVGEGRALRVAIHVRRGELLVLDRERMLPNSYYVNVAQEVAHVLDALKVDYQIELHTEVPNREFFVQPDHPGIYNRISAPTAVSPKMCRLDEFGVLPNLVLCANETAIECIRKFATADILVMSRSSFSYLGGILNRNGIMLYHPFWHRAPSSWMTVAPDGQFDRFELRRAVETFCCGPTPRASASRPNQ